MSSIPIAYWILGGCFVGIPAMFAAFYLTIRYTERRRIALGLLAFATTFVLPIAAYFFALTVFHNSVGHSRFNFWAGWATIAALIYFWLRVLKRGDQKQD